MPPATGNILISIVEVGKRNHISELRGKMGV
jgi:hypothetical protein